METQVDTTFIRPGPVTQVFAIAIAAMGLGIGILLGAWALSLAKSPTFSHEVRIVNPEISIKQGAPLVVGSAIPATSRTEPPLPPTPGQDTATEPEREVIQREVIVFFSVKHSPGGVVTGWIYPNGGGGKPTSQFCYYFLPNVDGSSLRVDIGSNGARLERVKTSLVPDVDEALKKCKWSPL